MDNIKYLNKVLNCWVKFCRTHKKIEKAIRELLDENQKLKQNIENIKSEISSNMKECEIMKSKHEKNNNFYGAKYCTAKYFAFEEIKSFIDSLDRGEDIEK